MESKGKKRQYETYVFKTYADYQRFCETAEMKELLERIKNLPFPTRQPGALDKETFEGFKRQGLVCENRRDNCPNQAIVWIDDDLWCFQCAPAIVKDEEDKARHWKEYGKNQKQTTAAADRRARRAFVIKNAKSIRQYEP